MKKILQYFILTIMAVCFSIPAFSSAEAATVALLPLVNNVKGDELAGQIFYQEAIGTLNDDRKRQADCCHRKSPYYLCY